MLKSWPPFNSVKFGISQVWGEATLPNTWLPPYQLAVLECKTSAQNHCTSRLPRPCRGGCVADLKRSGWMKMVIIRDAISIQFHIRYNYKQIGMDPGNSLMFFNKCTSERQQDMAKFNCRLWSHRKNELKVLVLSKMGCCWTSMLRLPASRLNLLPDYMKIGPFNRDPFLNCCSASCHQVDQIRAALNIQSNWNSGSTLASQS